MFTTQVLAMTYIWQRPMLVMDDEERIMAVSFSLLDIQALAPGLDSGERWQQWSEDLLWPETASLPPNPTHRNDKHNF